MKYRGSPPYAFFGTWKKSRYVKFALVGLNPSQWGQIPLTRSPLLTRDMNPTYTSPLLTHYMNPTYTNLLLTYYMYALAFLCSIYFDFILICKIKCSLKMHLMNLGKLHKSKLGMFCIFQILSRDKQQNFLERLLSSAH